MSEQTIPADLEAARLIITSADNKLAVCLKDAFRVSATPRPIPDDFELPRDAQQKLAEWHIPHDFVLNILKFVDLSRLSEKQIESVTEVTSYMVERYKAVLGVVAYKKDRPKEFSLDGQYSSVVPKRRKAVMDNIARLVPSEHSQTFRTLWDQAILQPSEAAQDDELNNNQGPLANTFEKMPWLLKNEAA